MMIAGKIGGQTLVAVSMCNTLFDIIQAVFIGLSVGSTILITRNVGCGHMELPRRITAHSIGLNLFLGIGIMLTLVLLGKNIITVLFRNLTDAVIEQSVQYLRITVWCIPFIGDRCCAIGGDAWDRRYENAVLYDPVGKCGPR